MIHSEGKDSILVIDDEKANIIALTSMLGEYTVYASTDGEDGIEAAKECMPDVILLDILMPGMDGYEVLSRLKADEATREIPVIFVTGLSDAGSEEKGLALGAADYIIKPFSPAIVKLRVINQMKILTQYNLIKNLSVTDVLTGIPNKRYFNDRLRIDWNYAIRNRSMLSIFLIDIDFFKKYNDTYGHLQGDTALRIVAETIEQSFSRSVDFAARWGGEEFAVLLPGTDLSGALVVAENIRKNVENVSIPCADGEITKVTISIGANTCMPLQESSMDDFVHRADQALYNAKKTGRNRVCSYEGESGGQ